MQGLLVTLLITDEHAGLVMFPFRRVLDRLFASQDFLLYVAKPITLK